MDADRQAGDGGQAGTHVQRVVAAPGTVSHPGKKTYLNVVVGLSDEVTECRHYFGIFLSPGKNGLGHDDLPHMVTHGVQAEPGSCTHHK